MKKPAGEKHDLAASLCEQAAKQIDHVAETLEAMNRDDLQFLLGMVRGLLTAVAMVQQTPNK